MVEAPVFSEKVKTLCYHCGDECNTTSIVLEEKVFCCKGCKTVYEILSSNEMSCYYTLNTQPGISMKENKSEQYDYLEKEEVIENLVDFKDETILKVQFYLPQIHCSACLWLLENLYRINPAIEKSRVNFLKKEIYISLHHKELSLKELVQLLASLGYEPKITFNEIEKKQKKKTSKKLIYQLGLAGFAFGNIMLMSLPDYFGFDPESMNAFRPWFGWLNLLLATPVAIYSGKDYFKSSARSLYQKRLNIDIPIALGIVVLYSRSVYEIVSKTGPGYFDSLCGLLFFLLLGRIFQEKIYHQLSFERDYRSYFPVVVSKLLNGVEKSIPINEIQKGDKILIRNGELIPVDAYLIKGKARIDNSFATGESKPVTKNTGDKIYAGGRQIGEAIQLEVLKPLNQSKLTRLWSDYADKSASTATFSELTDKISQWFTPAILIVALISGFYYLQYGLGTAVEVMSAVLIVACPCALALAAPFTFGHAVRWLGKQQFYIREASVIEALSKINHIVFDKTGTLTYGDLQKISFHGKPLDLHEQQLLRSMVYQSNHPLSRLLKNYLPKGEMYELSQFNEYEGKGLEGQLNKQIIRLGSASWLGTTQAASEASTVFYEIDGKIRGYFEFGNQYRRGLQELLQNLSYRFNLSLLSGDNDREKEQLKSKFPFDSLRFYQSPESKLQFISALQEKGNNVMMIGDGLNDAGALRKADVGISIAEDVNSFSPACDVILSAEQFTRLPDFLRFSRRSKYIVYISFAISLLYNLIGLSFAVQGILSPVIAALLMPISSVSVVAFVSFSVWLVRVKNKAQN